MTDLSGTWSIEITYASGKTMHTVYLAHRIANDVRAVRAARVRSLARGALSL